MSLMPKLHFRAGAYRDANFSPHKVKPNLSDASLGGLLVCCLLIGRFASHKWPYSPPKKEGSDLNEATYLRFLRS
jgi:hypothetical protein